MAEMTEAAHLDAREVREPVTPEVTGPVVFLNFLPREMWMWRQSMRPQTPS